MKRLVALVLAAASACARPAPAPRAAAPPSADRAAGALLSELLMGSSGPYSSPELERYVSRVGARVARALERRDPSWQFRVTDDPEPAAHALPGGTILISRGALAWLSSEAELAAVLAHELSHALMGHTSLDKSALPAHAAEAEARARALDGDEERQADALAVRWLARAGYDPRAVGSALAALRRGVVWDCERERARPDCADAHDAFDPHPAMTARLARVALAVESPRGELGRRRYLDAIDGLPLGGLDAVLQSGRFQTPGGLSFAVPEGFRPELSGHVLTAKSLGSELTIVRLHGRLFREAVWQSVRSSTYTSREVAGHRTLIGSFGDDAERRVAVLDDSPFVHVVAVSGAERDEHLERILGSVRPGPKSSPRLTIRGVTANEVTRFDQLLARRCPDTDPRLASALNGVAPGERVPRGRTLKCTRTK